MHLDERVTIATPEGIDLDLVIAGLGSRFVAALIDGLVKIAVIIALFFVLGLATSGSESAGGGWGAAAFIILIFLVLFAYDVVFEVMGSGRTLGKRAAGIRVVRSGGEPVGFLASTIRNVLRLVDFLPFAYAAGVATILLTKPGRRLGDLAAGTLVVRERSGGVRTPQDVARWAAAVTVPEAAVASWDVSALGADELNVVRHFLDRRLQLPWPARAQLAHELVDRLAPRIAGAPIDAHPEYVLEGIVVAKRARA